MLDAHFVPLNFATPGINGAHSVATGGGVATGVAMRLEAAARARTRARDAALGCGFASRFVLCRPDRGNAQTHQHGEDSSGEISKSIRAHFNLLESFGLIVNPRYGWKKQVRPSKRPPSPANASWDG
jgi:hypothetical protein